MAGAGWSSTSFRVVSKEGVDGGPAAAMTGESMPTVNLNGRWYYCFDTYWGF